jgi:hypothetical protein
LKNLMKMIACCLNENTPDHESLDYTPLYPFTPKENPLINQKLMN